MKKILFLLKERTVYSKGSHSSTGLLNSARLLATGLSKQQSFEFKVQEVIDQNSIDREVTLFTPEVVILEALWVTPEKLKELIRLHPKVRWCVRLHPKVRWCVRLHPKVRWCVRLHSEIPFLSGEGIAMDWIKQYKELWRNVDVAVNSDRIQGDLEGALNTKIHLLPNYYELDDTMPGKSYNKQSGVIRIGCFGAIRPLKNHLVQAHAAIHYARKHNLKLEFHINGNIFQETGNSILRNLRALFRDEIDAVLVEHDWMPHNKFLLLVDQMDLCLQVSFSETFNIVTADAVSQKIPVVTSKEITWVNGFFKASTTDVKDIVSKIGTALSMGKVGAFLNFIGLSKYNKQSLKDWTTYLKQS